MTDAELFVKLPSDSLAKSAIRFHMNEETKRKGQTEEIQATKDRGWFLDATRKYGR